MAVHSTRLELSFELYQFEENQIITELHLYVAAENLVEVLLEQSAFDETLTDTVITQFVPAENEVITELHQYVAAENLIEVLLEQSAFDGVLIDIAIAQFVPAKTEVLTELHQYVA